MKIPREDIRVNVSAWGSRGEIHEALRLISEARDEFGSEGVVVSHGYHHLRLRIILWKRSRKLGLDEMKWKFVGPKGPVKSVLHELYKVPGELLRPA